MEVPGGTGGEPCRSPVVTGGRSRMMRRGILPPPAPRGSHQAPPPAPLERLRLNISTVWLCFAWRSPSVFTGFRKPRASLARRWYAADRGEAEPCAGHLHRGRSRSAFVLCKGQGRGASRFESGPNGAGGRSASEERVRVGGSLEEQAAGTRLDASCGGDRL
jgi:hypothetical protein